MKKFEDYQKIYSKDLCERVVPFWLKHSPDWADGGTFSCLDKDGAVYDGKKYMWLVGRSVWMFCRLYNSLDKNPEYLKAAELGLRFIEKNAVDPQGRYYFSLTKEGKPWFYQRKVYSAVFIMLAYLEYYNLKGDSRYYEKAVELFEKIKLWVADPSLLGRPNMPGRPPTSSLADVMVLASMAIELAYIEPKQEYIDVMKKSLCDIKAHFVSDKNILIETAALGGEDISEHPEGRLFNPGHSIEAAWFLLHLLKFIPDEAMEKMAYDVIKGSLDYGWDKKYGGIYYFMDLQNKPTLQLESSMKLWWPHTEAIYALGLAYRNTGEQIWLDWLSKVHEYAYSHFIDYDYGGWFGYCDRRGSLTHTCKGGNYKGFFHVPRALLFTSQL
ncbi:Cellobiose 2-epimerase [Sedimentisphaera cyanobacteriorum]|uniref:Cellobiose 2-epimerase n=1 Tax=Sedimentisphaera cyanobacteriorum TaxID=1940790 RepID=A0A1Q2HS28_9BACT|nr:AGE family epimerase/isomerase [Sedimentisphaera cyanobacteriorum]AQQ10268.1 Cellobiose 2-epimerase [Sedimentisphaera cyanobacteriorum]